MNSLVTQLQEVTLSPKVSIGMPVYNGEKFIRKALDSLVNQTFADFELIISDNASTDNTYAICHEYSERDPRIKVIRQSSNMGAIRNFKYVFNQAKGEYFMWASSDDMWASDWIEKLLAKQNYTEVSMSFGVHFSIDCNDEIIAQHSLPFFGNSRFVRLANFYLYYNSRKANLLHCLFRRDILVKTNGFLDIWDGCMVTNDMLPIVYALQFGRLEYDQSTVLFKREHDGAASSKTKPSSFQSKLKTLGYRGIFAKLNQAVIPFGEISHDCYFLCKYFDKDVRLLFLLLFPYNIIKHVFYHYKNLILWSITTAKHSI